MQCEEFLQQLWLDYVHLHPDLGSLDFKPSPKNAEYLVIVTLNHGPFSAEALLPTLRHFGYRCAGQYAMADRGVLITLLSPATPGPWLVLGELQPGTLTREPRRQLEALVNQAQHCDTRGQNLLCRGRPWPMPDWTTYQQLRQAHPLAAWLAALGPRLHHAGFDCDSLGHPLEALDQRLQQAGLIRSSDRQSGVFPVSALLDYRFYPACTRRLAFADGDEHRIALGGIAMVQKRLSNNHERAAELLLPEHTRCAIA
ncbi:MULTISPECIES: DUF1338 family protein [Halomonadaceae]|uniref:2-oxoadipate dioxygenase/decarboxylase n=1 Tax=Modicisalibacter zincidurans TaxID=1178777 RepID=A0ABP9RJK0_9GAMM|nr:MULTISPECIES: DUF1338 family protein [Halomonas]MCD6007056.1 DUF1338 family protein [Halomonas sp. IOP_31]